MVQTVHPAGGGERMTESEERPVVTLFTRAECHLCQAARYVIERVATQVPLRFDLIDIDAPGQERWRELYTNDVPVVHVNGRELARHRIHERTLREALAGE